MGYLALSVMATTLIFVVFRLIGTYQVQTFQAIVVNYFVCIALGLVFLPAETYSQITAMPPLFYQIGLAVGSLFVVNFWFMGRATQVFGVAPATILARISLVIPAFFSVIAFGEAFNWLKGMGIIAALLAIVLTLYEPGLMTNIRKRSQLIAYLFPLGAFLCTGLIDSLFKVAEVNFLATIPNLLFLIALFSVAGLGGVLFIVFRYAQGYLRLDRRALPFGAMLGIVNFFGIYFLLLALSASDLGGSVLFPVNSVSIVALSTLISYIGFRESLNRYNLAGFSMAIAAILFITLA